MRQLPKMDWRQRRLVDWAILIVFHPKGGVVDDIMLPTLFPLLRATEQIETEVKIQTGYYADSRILR